MKDANGKEFDLGDNHIPFLKVGHGGSSCATCRFLSENGKDCTNKYFIGWYGKAELPQPITEWCSDWWEGKEQKNNFKNLLNWLNKEVTFKELFQ